MHGRDALPESKACEYIVALPVCNDCDHYDMAECVCVRDGAMQHPLTPACERFEIVWEE